MKHLQRTATLARVATVAATLAGSIVVAGTGSAMAAPKPSARAAAAAFACPSGQVCTFDTSGALLQSTDFCDNSLIFNLGYYGFGDRTYMMVNQMPGTIAQAYNYSHGWVAVGPGVGYDQYWTYATGSPQGIDGFKVSCGY